jgi:hypothetical protein
MKRPGFSLVELVAVITGVSVILGGAITLMTFILRMSDEVRDRTHTVAMIGRLAGQFRRDVHEARGEPSVAPDHRSAEFQLFGGSVVRWRIDNRDGLVRVEHTGRATDRQNTYCLPQGCTAELHIKSQGTSKIVALRIDSPGVSEPSLAVEALAGEDQRLRVEDEK